MMANPPKRFAQATASRLSQRQRSEGGWVTLGLAPSDGHAVAPRTCDINILHFSPLYPPHVGGLESHAAQFDEHLSASGITITVFTPRLPSTAPSHEIINSRLAIFRFPAVELIPNYPFPALWRLTFWRQLHAVRASRPDLIISRTRFFSTSVLAFVLAAVWQRPWLHIEHGSDYVSLNNTPLRVIAKMYDQTIGRIILRQATMVAANSRSSAQFVRRLARRDARVIYRGIDHERIASISPDDVIRQRFPGRLLITFIGRLIDGKGVADLIHAIHQLTAGSPVRPGIRCLIIGDGPQRRALERQAQQLKLEPCVSFLGELSHDRTIAILKSSDIFVNPSHTEGIPTTVIEAALCRTATIATNVGGTTEVITGGVSALLISPRQPDRLAEKLRVLLADPTLRQRLAAAAYQEVSRRFSWAEAITAYQKILSDVVRA